MPYHFHVSMAALMRERAAVNPDPTLRGYLRRCAAICEARAQAIRHAEMFAREN